MKFRRRSLKRYLVPLTIPLILVSSCSEEKVRDNRESVPPWSISFRWSAAPDIDLDSKDLRMVRAAIESNTIAEFLDRDYGYPGWYRANERLNYFVSREHPLQEGFGTAYLHVIADTKYSSHWTVCKDMSETATKVGGRYPFPDFSNSRETLQDISVSIYQASNGETTNSVPSKIPPGPTILGPDNRTARPSEDVFSKAVHPDYDYQPSHQGPCSPWAEARWGGTQPPKPTRSETEPPKIEPFVPGWAKQENER